MTVSVMNTQVAFWALTLTDQATGALVPTPPSDAFSVTSSAPGSFSAAIGADPGGSSAVGVIGTPLVLESDAGNSGGNIMLHVTDSNSDVAAVIGPVNVTLVPVIDQITVGGPTFTTQAAPTAPGP